MKRLFTAIQLLAECVWTLLTDKEEQLQLCKAQGYDIEDDQQFDSLKKAIGNNNKK
jgi:hypothetical protein